MANKKNQSGRPSSYKTEYAEQARKLCELGATDAELADFFEVGTRTIYRWQATHEEFRQALKGGKEQADDRVERSLYQKAVGYSQDSVKIFMPAGASEPVYAGYREKVAPDTTAAIFWLKNRRPAEWRDKTVQEQHVSTDDQPTDDGVEELTEALDNLRARNTRQDEANGTGGGSTSVH